MAHNRGYGWCSYTPTITLVNTPVYIKTDNQTAANNGQTAQPNPAALSFWPLHAEDLRAVYGVDALKFKDRCTAMGSGGLFALGQTFFDFEGNQFTVNGLRQERFRIRDLV